MISKDLVKRSVSQECAEWIENKRGIREIRSGSKTYLEEEERKALLEGC